MLAYKIRQKSTGLFSTGVGVLPNFTKVGKVFNKISSVKSHISRVNDYRWQTYKDAEVVKYEIVEDEEESMDIKDFMEGE